MSNPNITGYSSNITVNNANLIVLYDAYANAFFDHTGTIIGGGTGGESISNLHTILENGNITTNVITLSGLGFSDDVRIASQGTSVSIGFNCGTNDDCIAIGTNAGTTNQETGTISIGTSAGQTGQNTYSIAVGYDAGKFGQGETAVAIGLNAGREGQGKRGTSIGYQAGRTNQNDSATSVGSFSGYNNQGPYCIAVGAEAGYNYQNTLSIAIGRNAGREGQYQRSIAVGAFAGRINQGERSVSIGNQAAQTGQGNDAICIGSQACYENQNNNGIAIGTNAGRLGQGKSAIALGNKAGKFGQAENTIAIGKQAGENYQNYGSIILNTSGVALESSNNNAVYIKPIRSVAHRSNILAYSDECEVCVASNVGIAGDIVANAFFNHTGTIIGGEGLQQVLEFGNVSTNTITVGGIVTTTPKGTSTIATNTITINQDNKSYKISNVVTSDSIYSIQWNNLVLGAQHICSVEASSDIEIGMAQGVKSSFTSNIVVGNGNVAIMSLFYDGLNKYLNCLDYY